MVVRQGVHQLPAAVASGVHHQKLAASVHTGKPHFGGVMAVYREIRAAERVRFVDGGHQPSGIRMHKELGITGYSSLTKDKLVNKLRNH